MTLSKQHADADDSFPHLPRKDIHPVRKATVSSSSSHPAFPRLPRCLTCYRSHRKLSQEVHSPNLPDSELKVDLGSLAASRASAGMSSQGSYSVLSLPFNLLPIGLRMSSTYPDISLIACNPV